MLSYAQYCKIKNNYCIGYFGHSDEYLVQLRLLKGIIERTFNGLNLFIGCKDDKTHLLKDCNILKISEIKMRKHEFAQIKELTFNSISHPVEDLLKKSDINNCIVSTQSETPTTKCVIITKGSSPTKNLSADDVDFLIEKAKFEKFDPVIDENVDNAGWVMGVESPELFAAAGAGIKTTLIPNGFGTCLYKNMFPNGEVMYR